MIIIVIRQSPRKDGGMRGGEDHGSGWSHGIAIRGRVAPHYSYHSTTGTWPFDLSIRLPGTGTRVRSYGPAILIISSHPRNWPHSCWRVILWWAGLRLVRISYSASSLLDVRSYRNFFTHCCRIYTIVYTMNTKYTLQLFNMYGIHFVYRQPSGAAKKNCPKLWVGFVSRGKKSCSLIYLLGRPCLLQADTPFLLIAGCILCQDERPCSLC